MMKSVRLREYGTALILVMCLQAASVHAAHWPHPVIIDGKLYLRWDDNLYVYDIKK